MTLNIDFSPGPEIARGPQLAEGGSVARLEIASYTHHRSPVSFQSIFIPGGVRRLEIPGPILR